MTLLQLFGSVICSNGTERKMGINGEKRKYATFIVSSVSLRSAAFSSSWILVLQPAGWLRSFYLLYPLLINLTYFFKFLFLLFLLYSGLFVLNPELFLCFTSYLSPVPGFDFSGSPRFEMRSACLIYRKHSKV